MLIYMLAKYDCVHLYQTCQTLGNFWSTSGLCSNFTQFTRIVWYQHEISDQQIKNFAAIGNIPAFLLQLQINNVWPKQAIILYI